MARSTSLSEFELRLAAQGPKAGPLIDVRAVGLEVLSLPRQVGQPRLRLPTRRRRRIRVGADFLKVLLGFRKSR